MAKFGKNYPTKEEYKFRYEIFQKSVNFIKNHDVGEHGFTVGINEMSDWTEDEFAKINGKMHKKQRKLIVKDGKKKLPENDLPESVDWRRDKAVSTPVM